MHEEDPETAAVEPEEAAAEKAAAEVPAAEARRRGRRLLRGGVLH